MPSPLPHSALTSDRILSAARRVFAERGRDGARMHHIAIAGKVNQALLHYYFDNKDNLYRQALRQLFDGVIAGVRPILQGPEAAPQKIRRFVDFYIDFIAAHPEMPPIMMRELAGGAKVLLPVLRQLGEEHHFFLPLEIRNMLQAGMASRQLRPVAPEQAVLHLMGLVLVYFVAKPLFGAVMGQLPEKQFLPRRKAAILDLLQHGLFHQEER